MRDVTYVASIPHGARAKKSTSLDRPTPASSINLLLLQLAAVGMQMLFTLERLLCNERNERNEPKYLMNNIGGRVLTTLPKIMTEQDPNDPFVLSLPGIPSWTRPRNVSPGPLSHLNLYPPGTISVGCAEFILIFDSGPTLISSLFGGRVPRGG